MVEPAKVEIELAEGDQVVKVGDVEWYVNISLTPLVHGAVVTLSPSDQLEMIRQRLVSLHKESPNEQLIQAIYSLETSSLHVRAWQRANA